MTRTVIARMRVDQIEVYQPEGTPEPVSKTVRLSPVYSDDPDSPNYSFSTATPAGLLQLTITNPAASGSFDPNEEKDIYIVPRGTRVLIEPAPDDEPAPADDARKRR